MAWKCSICLRHFKNKSEDGNRRGLYTLKTAGMAVMAQNRFRTAARRQDSFHYEGRRPSGNPATSNANGVLSVPAADQQPRRHSTGHINIAALQPNLENLKLQQEVSRHKNNLPLL